MRKKKKIRSATSFNEKGTQKQIKVLHAKFLYYYNLKFKDFIKDMHGIVR